MARCNQTAPHSLVSNIESSYFVGTNIGVIHRLFLLTYLHAHYLNDFFFHFSRVVNLQFNPYLLNNQRKLAYITRNTLQIGLYEFILNLFSALRKDSERIYIVDL